ncbi:MAG: DUF4956 domain-containing protein [Candidatus Bathyarchaeota archaeon]|nr:DUF4956 domain-containing protein [Candidatus Bathyarchaeota archaeon]
MADLQQWLTDLLTPSATYETLTVDRVVIALVMSFLINLVIFYIYRKTFKGVVYNRQFNIGLVLTGLVVTLVVLPISSNVALSLGMIGALSIIRFRTAIKDPKDIVFTFWTITVGIICGAGLYIVAIIGVPVIAVMLVVLERTKIRGPDPYLLVVHYTSAAENAVQAALPKHKIRSRTVNADGVELMGEVRMSSKEVPQVDELLKIKGVKDASIVSYTSDST